MTSPVISPGSSPATPPVTQPATSPGTPVADPLTAASDWLAAGRGVALATVVSTWGSAPVPVGSRMAVDEQGRMAGSVSGGCIEAAVVTEAAAVLSDGQARLLEYGVSHEMAWEVGLACGGRIAVFVEPVV